MRYLIALCVLLCCSIANAGFLFGPNNHTTVYYGSVTDGAVYDAYPMISISTGQTHRQARHTRLAAKFQKKVDKHTQKATQ